MIHRGRDGRRQEWEKGKGKVADLDKYYERRVVCGDKQKGFDFTCEEVEANKAEAWSRLMR